MNATIRMESITKAPPVQPPMHDARILTQNGRTAQIALDDMVYTLTITRAGKLILTK